MPKVLRKSTLRQREEREKAKKVRVIPKKKLFKRTKHSSHEPNLLLQSRKLKNLIEEEEELFRRELRKQFRLVSTLKENLEDSLSSISLSPIASRIDIPAPSSPSHLGSEESLDWDDQGDLKSPLKDTSDILDSTFSCELGSPPPALNRERSDSVSINRAKYVCGGPGESFDLQPVCRNLNRDSVPSSLSLGLISQESFLVRNLREKEIEALELIDERETDLEQNLRENHLDAIVGDTGNMDETEFKRKLQKLKQSKRRVEYKISGYTAEDITAADKDDYKAHLKSIRDVFEAFIEEANRLVDELTTVDSEEVAQVAEVEGLMDELSKKFKKNEKDVKEKILEALTAHDANRPLSQSERKLETLKTEKLIKRMGFIKEKSTDLQRKILQLKQAKDMSDTEVREHVAEVKDWERTAKEITSAKETAEEDSVGLAVQDTEVMNMKETVQAALDALTAKVDNLKLEDKKRGLFSNIKKSIPKDDIVFPEAFRGIPGENVFRFKEKFMRAIFDSQVREKDKVEVLRKHLTGEAKKLIGDHYLEVDSAMDALVSYFGQAERIWEKSKSDVLKKLGGNFKEVWGEYGTQKRVTAIAIAIEFVREAMELAKTYPELSNEVYHSSTLKLLREILPRDYIEKFNDLINGQKGSHEEKITNVKEFLEAKKNSALDGVGNSIEPEDIRRGASGGRSEYPKKTNYGENLDDDRTECQFCDGKNCRVEWQALGCMELYKKKTVDERKEFLQSHRACFRCGSTDGIFTKFNVKNKHVCDWKGRGKFHAKCKVEYCMWSAVTCNNHKANMSGDLIKWFKSLRINTKHLTQVIVFSGVPKNIDLSKMKTNNTTRANIGNNSSTTINKISKEVRDKLQKGELCNPMNDEQLVKFFEDDLKKVSKTPPDVRAVPEGEPIFIMCVFKGVNGPVLAFIDHGCNCWVANEGIPETKLVSCKLQDGPIPMGVASGLTVYASAEWASLLPLADGGHQVVRGLTVPRVTQDMPEIDMIKIFNSIKKNSKEIKSIQNLKVPKFVGGKIDMILGIKYQNIYPELVHQFPNGLAVFKSKLMPVIPGEVACIGGPIGALEGLAGVIGDHSALGYLTQLTLKLSNYKRLDFFPTDDGEVAICDTNIPGIKEFFEDDERTEVEKKRISLMNITCYECGDEVFEDNGKEVFTIQGELKRFQQQQDVGLDQSYRCPKCRSCGDCVKGSGYEEISLKQEAEQVLIQNSVHIDLDKGRAMCKLPFKADPKEFLSDNTYCAQKRLSNVCRKYHNDDKVKQEISAAFDKLRNRGHIKFYEDLNIDQRNKLEKAEIGYTIPWDVVWKETSLSTPARTVYDASSKCSTGFSLNDILATGICDMVKLVDIVMDWQIGPIAFVGDVSQFYCTIGMAEESWQFQKLLLREDLNPNGKLIRAVIVSAIFGVCSSGGQSEEVIRQFAELIKDEFPEVAKLLLKKRYVDDLGKSVKTKQEALKLMATTEEVLERIKMEIKGWGITGENPPEQLSDDGISIGFAGMTFLPGIDSFKLNISNLHFGKKKRGKYAQNLEIFEEETHGSVEKFVEGKTITRRTCTSVCARIYDLVGKLAPVTLKMKADLRKLIQENPSWDDPISSNQRLVWTKNFKIIQDCRDIMYFRCPIPPNAVNLKATIWILCDAADVGIIIAAYVCFEMPENKWSCSNLIGKNLLPPEAWTIPKKELQGLTSACNVKVAIERSLEDWIENVFVAGDSEIALSWCIYENVKLNIFHRNRVNSIRSKVRLDQLHHVVGTENPTDIGTRPDLVTAESVRPGSIWLSGKDWMKKPYEEAVANGIIKSVKDIKLSNDAKKILKEGIIFDTFDKDESNVAVAKINTIDIKKVAEMEAFSRYIYDPLKRSFRPTVRIISLVLRAVRKFKEGRIRSKIRDGKMDISELEKLSPKNVKFTAFQVVNAAKSSIFDEDAKDMDGMEKLTDLFVINGVKCTFSNTKKHQKEILIRLTDEELSEGLEYLFKKATQEILKFENKKEVEKVGVMKDEILYCYSRILEGQDLKAVGCLSETIDLETFTGMKFCVPLVSKYSPLAISLALHMHYNVNKHRGTETTFRLSLQHARILQGRQLFKEVADDCIFCKKLRLRYTKQLMGPLAESQLSISPIFYFTLIDMWGPIKLYCPGYEKRTRNRKMDYDAYMLVMGCAATGTINCQIIEQRNTGSVLDGLNRFFCETTVPKICYPDMDGALMKALREGEISLIDMQGRLHRERGILFETCLPQGHYAHGRIERRIRMIQESLDRSELRYNTRCTATGWQTISKAIEREVNGIPLGYLYHQGTANPLLKVLCPSILKNGTFSDRSPKSLFSIPNSPADLMTRIEDIYMMWFQVWNVNYIPLIMDRPKWQLEGENLREQDLVYFKLTDSALAADWRLGKVEYVNTSRDGKIREVGIAYKIMDEDDGWRHSVVERPSRAVVKLMNIEDTSLIEDIKKVRDLAKELVKNEKLSVDDLASIDGPEADDIDEDPKDKEPGLNRSNRKEEIFNDENQSKTDDVVFDNEDENKQFLDENVKSKKRKKKTEVERLIIDNKKFEVPVDGKRIKKNKVSNPTMKMIQTAENYQNIVRAFTNQPKVDYTANNVENSSDTTFTFPEHITHASQVGVVTSALLGGATQMIVGGARVNYSQGLGSDVLVGESGIRGLRENDKNVLYLI